eukprot:m51a1_g10743 hypothetical protein (312) ;mRNA; f:335983-336918
MNNMSDLRGRFERLLREAGVVFTSDSVFRVAMNYGPSLQMVKTPDEAASLYEASELIPRTTTRQRLRDDCGISFAEHARGFVPSRSAVLPAFDSDNVPLMLKITEDPWMAEAEWDVYQLLQDGIEGSFLVPLRAVTLRRNRTKHVRRRYARGEAVVPQTVLAMPFYPQTMAQRPPPVSTAVLLRCGRCVRRALQHMHVRGVCHMDVKPSNIMVGTSGDCFLGDYGAAVRTGEHIRGSPRRSSPATRAATRRPRRPTGWLLLAVTLLVLLVLHKPYGSLTIQEVQRLAGSIEDPEAHNFVAEVLAMGVRSTS